MKYLSDLVEENGDRIEYFRLSISERELQNYTIESVFNCSDRHGGTFDSFKYYNDYVILIPKNKVSEYERN